MRRSAGDTARGRIRAHLEDNPGISKSQMCRDLGMAWGTVSYHVALLVKRKEVRLFARGKEVRLFPAVISDRHIALLSVLYQPEGEALLCALRAKPGLQLRDLADNLSISRKVIRRHLTMLGGEGLVEIDRTRRPRYRLGAPGVEILAQANIKDILRSEGSCPGAPDLGRDR